MKEIAAIALATILSALGIAHPGSRQATAEFVFRDSQSDFVATVTLPDPLPFQNFEFAFQDPQYKTNGAFEYEREGGVGCYFSRGMPIICSRLAGTTEPLPDRISDGSRLIEQRRGDVWRYVLDDGSFADFRGGHLQRFGTLNEDGSTANSYDRVMR